MKKFIAYFKIIRPVNFIISFASIIVAGLICASDAAEFHKIILAALSGALIGSGGNIINDYFDIEIDKINRPARPLPKGLLTKTEAIIFYMLLNLSALVLSAFIYASAFIIAALALIVIFFYSYKLKKVLLFGNITVSFFTGMAFIYGGVSAGNWKDAVIPAVFAFFTNFIREVVKDIEDIKGDSTFGIVTYPAAKGISSALKLINFSVILLIFLTAVPFLAGIYRIEYFILVMPVVNGLFVYFMKSLSEDQSLKNIRRLSSLIKLNMVIGLIAIYLGNY